MRDSNAHQYLTIWQSVVVNDGAQGVGPCLRGYNKVAARKGRRSMARFRHIHPSFRTQAAGTVPLFSRKSVSLARSSADNYHGRGGRCDTSHNSPARASTAKGERSSTPQGFAATFRASRRKTHRDQRISGTNRAVAMAGLEWVKRNQSKNPAPATLSGRGVFAFYPSFESELHLCLGNFGGRHRLVNDLDRCFGGMSQKRLGQQ